MEKTKLKSRTGMGWEYRMGWDGMVRKVNKQAKR